MAFIKTAKAAVTRPAIDLSGWNKIRVASNNGVAFTKESAKVVLQQYDPSNFLLTHCTIMASVDTESVKADLGTQMFDAYQIDRRYADFYVTAKTQQYINNNHDAWERKLLLACFKTFVGAENYVEHIQIPAMSRGKIIDAAARDIGDSVYVDILVATDRKHKPLVEAITSGKLGTLSMGCQVQFTICTKCGNVAYDETQLCPHIRYQKGAEFYDELGNKRRIAELCGHLNSEPGSVKFIEASWVANPAFTGAVLRSILTPEEAAQMGPKIHLAHNIDAAPSAAMMARAASILDDGSVRVSSQEYGDKVAEFNFDAPAEGGADAKPADKGPIDKLVDDLKGAIREQALKDLRSEIGKGEAEKVQDVIDPNTNDSLIKSAFRHASWRGIARTVYAMTGKNPQVARKVLLGLIMHKAGGWKAVADSHLLSGREILAVARVIEHASRRASQAGEARIYRTAVAVGGLAKHASPDAYLRACRAVVGRELTSSEKAALLHKGRLFDLGS